MKKLFAIATLFVIFLAEAQAGNENVSYSSGHFFMRANRPTNKEYIIEGSPYSNGDKFTKVVIKGFGTNVQDLRYNAYEDEMEFKSGDELFFANKEEDLIITFKDLNKKYKCLKYLHDGKYVFGYLQLLVDNPKISLYKREKVELLKGEKSTNAYSKDANDYYAKMKDIYLVNHKERLVKFPKNVSDASEFFSIDKKLLSDFVTNNKMNFSKESDMIKLIEFVNNN